MGLTAARVRTVPARLWAAERLQSFPAALATLAVLHAAVFLVRIGQLGLYVDDWDHLHGVMTIPVSSLLTTFPMDYRPFDELPWLILGRTFGTNLVPYYLVFFALRYVTSILLYLFARKLSGSSLFALGCALVWSVYPSDTSVFWLTSFAYRFGAAFLLASATLLVISPSWRTRTAYRAAVLCCMLCLLSNEIFLGLCACLPALAWFESRAPLSRRIRQAFPFVIAIFAYLAYREWVGPHVFHFIDPKPAGLIFAPGQVAVRLLRATFVQLMGGWMAAAAGIAGSSEAVLVAILCVLVWLLGFTGLLMLRDRSRPGSPVRLGDSESLMPPGPWWLVFGLAVMLVGYVPLVFTDVPPALGEIASRVNAGASIGAAVFFVGIAWVLAYRPDLNAEVSRRVFVAVVLILTLGGIAMQEHSASTYAGAWAAQRAFWRSTVRVTHTVRTNSTIVLLAPHEGAWDTVQSLPPASFQAAFSLMYPQSNVHGIVLLRRELKACGGMGLLENGVVRTIRLERTGFRYLDTDVFVPYSKAVVLEYSHRRQPTVQVATGRQNKNPACQIEGNTALLKGRPLRASSWYQLAVAGT
jgi:hypothetical protein